MREADELWVIKIPTNLDPKALAPIRVDKHDYTVCIEEESGYGGDYPLCYEVVNYYVPNPHGYTIVPYKGKKADDRYGFYEFDSRHELRQWMKKHPAVCAPFLESHPEFFV